jgi:hypothetical protein
MARAFTKPPAVAGEAGRIAAPARREIVRARFADAQALCRKLPQRLQESFAAAAASAEQWQRCRSGLPGCRLVACCGADGDACQPVTATIRSRLLLLLLLLLLAVLLPGLVGVIWIIGSASATEHREQERVLRDSARTLSLVVDRELSQRAVLARVLVQSRWLDGPDITADQVRGFEVEARRALMGVDGWLELRVPGSTLLDTRWPRGAPARRWPSLW